MAEPLPDFPYATDRTGARITKGYGMVPDPPNWAEIYDLAATAPMDDVDGAQQIGAGRIPHQGGVGYHLGTALPVAEIREI